MTRRQRMQPVSRHRLMSVTGGEGGGNGAASDVAGGCRDDNKIARTWRAKAKTKRGAGGEGAKGADKGEARPASGDPRPALSRHSVDVRGPRRPFRANFR
ncbi:unnamed protein product [Pieris brassicae]|uniref:Uncharacterized protein n=1 Tax=Pieris brassicae TaxID=7116 RepID=A0A9P0TTE0_PIEBR|nr:unnamed protein product [Pieris brassicae]